MEKQIENLENFKKAIASTIKSIIGDQNIDVVFGDEITKKNINTIRLPNIQNIDNKIDYIKTRAIADSEALKLRCSDINIYTSFEPKGNISKLLYAVAEKIRYESIGSAYFKGVKENLNQYYDVKSKQKKNYKNIDYEFVDAFENYLRGKVFKFNNNKEIENKYKKYKKKLDIKLKDKLDLLTDSIFDQTKFNSLISEIISQIQIDENTELEKSDEEQKSESGLDDKINNENMQTSKDLENNDISVDTSLPDLNQMSSEIDNEVEVSEEDKSLNSPKNNRENNKNFGDLKYRYYTQEFDEIINAKELENEEELLKLR